ncbi:MAG TPA: serine protease [Caulobacteraceae bacterium]|nr:serine protease [Caulobacteraceae bacterium]
MSFPKLPDWTIYAAAVAALVMASLGRRENADAPPAPPPPGEEEGLLIGPASPFDPMVLVDAPRGPTQPASGTAFAVSTGTWLTARHVVEGCRDAALVVSPGRAVAARVRLARRADVAVLTTEGGPEPLPVGVERALHEGQRAFHPGFPQGYPGEVASRLLGRETLRELGRGRPDEPVLAWAEVGRTDGLRGTLAGLSGAPALDSAGRVVGVTVAEAPRRGRIYTTAPETLRPILSRRSGAAEFGPRDPVTVENYGRTADTLRRELRVAQVVCMST